MTWYLDRRSLLQTGAAGLGYFFTAPAFSAMRAADEPNNKLRIACIGIGGKGDSDSSQAEKVGQIVAICDIDDQRLTKKGTQKGFEQAKKFVDYRKLIDEVGKEIDAAVVSTPDHTHASPALQLMTMKKHVYVQKPLTHSVWEARMMRTIAKKYGVCTQMGNQGTAETGLRRAVELIQDGILGQIKEIHVWTNRPVWPQAPGIVKRPDEAPVPPHVHWDEFIGPAPFRPFGEKYYHPFNWRGWLDFGTGALGDMACHTANMAFMACKLAFPTSVMAEAGDVNPETHPSWARVKFDFPARGEMKPCAFYWYEGKRDGKKVLPPQELLSMVLRKDEKLADSGSIIVGEKGILFSPNDYGAAYRITPGELVEGKNLKELTRLATNGRGDQGMKDEWAAAIKQNKPEVAYSNFEYAAMLTETILLGNIAIKLTGEKLEWDGPNLKFTNSSAANQLVRRENRKGWEIPNL
jgi:predicted dehydrogenase